MLCRFSCPLIARCDRRICLQVQVLARLQSHRQVHVVHDLSRILAAPGEQVRAHASFLWLALGFELNPHFILSSACEHAVLGSRMHDVEKKVSAQIIAKHPHIHLPLPSLSKKPSPFSPRLWYRLLHMSDTQLQNNGPITVSFEKHALGAVRFSHTMHLSGFLLSFWPQ